MVPVSWQDPLVNVIQGRNFPVLLKKALATTRAERRWKNHTEILLFGKNDTGAEELHHPEHSRAPRRRWGMHPPKQGLGRAEGRQLEIRSPRDVAAKKTV